MRFMVPRRKNDDLWMQATSLNISTLITFIVDNDFDDKNTRKYNKSAAGVYLNDDKYCIFVAENGETKKKRTFTSFDDAARALATGDVQATSFPCAERDDALNGNAIQMCYLCS